MIIESNKKYVKRLCLMNNLILTISFLSLLIFGIFSIYNIGESLEFNSKVVGLVLVICSATSRYLVYRLSSLLTPNGLGSVHWEPFAKKFRPHIKTYNLFILVIAILAIVPLVVALLTS